MIPLGPQDKKPCQWLLPSSFIRVLFLLFLLGLALWCRARVMDANEHAPSLTDSKSAYELYAYAKQLDSRTKFDLGEKYLKRSLELKPDFHKAMIELGCLYYENGDYLKALPYFKDAVLYAKDDKANYEIALYNLAKVYFVENKVDEAWKTYRAAYKIKSVLGENQWPDIRSEAVHYVKRGDKKGFAKIAKKIRGPEFERRMEKIKLIEIINPRLALEDCNRFLTQNPGSRFSNKMLVRKARALQRLKEYAQAVQALQAIDVTVLSDAQKDAVQEGLFQNYLLSDQYALAIKALEYLGQNNADEYPPMRIRLEKSKIFKEQKDYVSEKRVLEEIVNTSSVVQNMPSKGSFLPNPYTLTARQRLFEIYTVGGDYVGAFRQIVPSYSLGNSLITILSLLLYQGFLVFLFFLFLCVFFRKKLEESKKSKMRLWHLWFFSVVIGLFSYIVPMLFLSFNYYTANSLGRLKLDPYTLSLMTQLLFIVALCVFVLRKEYHFYKIELGFVWKNAWCNIGIPLIALIWLLALAAFYMNFLDQFLRLELPVHPMESFIEQIRTDSGSLQKGLFVVFIAGIVPLAEEILFRVFLFLFFKNFTSNAIALILSALIFAVGHDVPLLIPYYFVVALTFSFIYLRTKSIVPAIITHGLMNLTMFVAGSN